MEEEKEINLLDIMILLAKNKTKILLSGFIIGLLVFVGVSFLPKSYKSTAVFVPTRSSGSSLMSLVGSASVGDIIGENPFSKRQYLEILNSRWLIEEVISEFDLITYYKQDKNKINPLDRTIKMFRKDVKIDMSEEGGLGITDVLSISVNVVNKNPQTAADIANFIVKKMEDRSREIYAQSFSGGIKFLEKQIEENAKKSFAASEALENFQKANNIYSIQTQISLSLSTYAMNLAEISSMEKQIEMLKLTQSSSSDITTLQNRIQYIKNQNKKIETGGLGGIFPGLNNAVSLTDEYTRLMLDAKMYEQLQILLVQQKLQTQMKIDRDYSAIYLIDSAVPAEYKFKPKRIKYCIVVLVLWYLYLIPSIIIKNMLASMPENDGTMQKIHEFRESMRFRRKKIIE